VKTLDSPKLVGVLESFECVIRHCCGLCNLFKGYDDAFSQRNEEKGRRNWGKRQSQKYVKK
jgi:hypothetical protein